MPKRYLAYYIIAIALALAPASAFAAPEDNDASYKLPLYMPGQPQYQVPNAETGYDPNSPYADPKAWLRYQQQLQAQNERQFQEQQMRSQQAQQERMKRQLGQVQAKQRDLEPAAQGSGYYPPGYYPPQQQPAPQQQYYPPQPQQQYQYVPQDNDSTYRLPGSYSPSMNQNRPGYQQQQQDYKYQYDYNDQKGNSTGTYDHNYYQ